MKKISRFLFVVTLMLLISAFTHAQQLKTGDMISGVFDSPLNANAKNLFVAEVTAVNGTSFTCRFVHSNSSYEFENYQMQDGEPKAQVKSKTKGVFKAGTWFYFYGYTPAEECGSTLKVKFGDQKVFLAETTSTGDDYTLRFTHSNSKYVVSKDGTILKSGGTYAKGGKVTWECLKKYN